MVVKEIFKNQDSYININSDIINRSTYQRFDPTKESPDLPTIEGPFRGLC